VHQALSTLPGEGVAENTATGVMIDLDAERAEPPQEGE
jgi:hypothetical protein